MNFRIYYIPCYQQLHFFVGESFQNVLHVYHLTAYEIKHFYSWNPSYEMHWPITHQIMHRRSQEA